MANQRRVGIDFKGVDGSANGNRTRIFITHLNCVTYRKDKLTILLNLTVLSHFVQNLYACGRRKRLVSAPADWRVNGGRGRNGWNRRSPEARVNECEFAGNGRRERRHPRIRKAQNILKSKWSQATPCAYRSFPSDRGVIALHAPFEGSSKCPAGQLRFAPARV